MDIREKLSRQGFNKILIEKLIASEEKYKPTLTKFETMKIWFKKIRNKK
jgi:hypothetical protein